MYGYEPHIDITPDQVLQKITQKEIFEFVFDHPIDFDHKYCSPLRPDKNPGCRFEVKEDGTILFIDFGERLLTGHTHRTWMRMVMDKFSVSSNTALKLVVQKFQLSTDAGDYTESTSINYDSDKEVDETEIRYDKKHIPTRTDIGFWTQFLIRMEHLEEDHVYCAQRFSLKNKRKGYRVITPYKYCYAMDFFPKVKIYQPFNGDYKWITNCNENNIWNIDNLPATGDELIIEKAYKDHRIIRNVVEGSNVIAFQSEGAIPDGFILKNLVDRFKLITIFYDNDESGILAAVRLQSELEKYRVGCSRIVYMPHGIVHGEKTVKDIGDFVPWNGRKETLTILKQILYGG